MCVCCHSLSGAKKKQKTVSVVIRKSAKQTLGLILSKNHYFLNSRGDIGVRNSPIIILEFVMDVLRLFQFMIVGVVKGSPVFNLVQSDQIKLLDVIESVNDTPCQNILSGDVDVQERFERYVEDRQSVKLILIHTTPLPISGPLAYGRLHQECIMCTYYRIIDSITVQQRRSLWIISMWLY